MATVLMFALMIWAIAFFTIFSSNAQQEANDWAKFTAATWVGALLSMFLLIFVLPEFFHYLGIRNSLVEMLETDSRAELQKNKKDCEEAVKLLAGPWPARLEAKRVELGLRKELPDGMDVPDDEMGWFGNWFSTKNSRFAERFPDSTLLADSGINQIIIGTSLMGFFFFAYNAIFGLARETITSPRNMTVDLTGIVKGSTYNATWAPHFDVIGTLLIITFGVLLFMTTPAPEIVSSSSENDESTGTNNEEEE